MSGSQLPTNHRSSSTSGKPTLASNPHNPSSAAYLAYPVKHVVSSLYRRMTEPPDQPVNKLLDAPTIDSTPSSSSRLYTPPNRNASPFQPPPLTPLELRHSLSSPDAISSLLLTRSLAEEIRLLIPARLQLLDNWKLAYSLEQHGSSLGTLYEQCRDISPSNQRGGYVLVVRDGSTSADEGSVFGAYLTDAPRPSQSYFGTGECFLWRASILPSLQTLSSRLNGSTNGANKTNIQASEHLLELAGLPPPPSANTTNMQRFTTIRGERRSSSSASKSPPVHSPGFQPLSHLTPSAESESGRSTPTSSVDRIRFKAFPYSGINDFMIYCESSYLSIGGGDGHYGLWLDDTLVNGISETCLTFGNEPLSDEGKKFEVLGVEVWFVGAS